MERRDWVLLACTGSILLTLIGCTWWAEKRLEAAIPSYPFYNDSLVAIHHDTEKQVEDLESIKEKLDWIDSSLDKLRAEQSIRDLTRR